MSRYLNLCIITDYENEKEDILTKFMGSIGRMLYISPLYKSLAKYGKKELGLKIFNQHKEFYHFIARISFERILKKWFKFYYHYI